MPPGTAPRFRPRPHDPGNPDRVDQLVKAFLADRFPDTYGGTNAGEGVQVAVFDSWPAGLGGAGLADHVFDEYVTPSTEHMRCHHIDACAGDSAAAVKVDEYLMPDHGVFVTDILKDVAPNATLNVYRVLDDRGIGDMHQVGRALQHALERDRELDAQGRPKPLVINLSLGFAMQLRLVRGVLGNAAAFHDDRDEYIRHRLEAQPAVPVRDPAAELAALAQQGLVTNAGGPGDVYFADALEALQALFGFELGADRHDNTLVVAAAGNDSCTDKLFGPRMPAVIEGVIGVSALADDAGSPAAYSNADDVRDPDDGIGAFGGTLPAAGTVTLAGADPPPGMVARYVSAQIPPDEPGSTGHPANQWNLAMWAGTSFACPVVAGLAACIWSEEPPGLKPDDVLRAIVYENDAGQVSRPFIPLRQRYVP